MLGWLSRQTGTREIHSDADELSEGALADRCRTALDIDPGKNPERHSRRVSDSTDPSGARTRTIIDIWPGKLCVAHAKHGS